MSQVKEYSEKDRSINILTLAASLRNTHYLIIQRVHGISLGTTERRKEKNVVSREGQGATGGGNLKLGFKVKHSQTPSIFTKSPY